MAQVDTYRRCRRKSYLLTDQELAYALRRERAKSRLSAEDRACADALEDEALYRLVERY